MNPETFPDAIAHLIDTSRIKLVRSLRDGPRYYTAEVQLDGNPVILKLVLPREASHEHPQTTAELSTLVQREIALLRAFETHAYISEGMSPRLHDYRLEPPAWYVRELINGQVFPHPETYFSYGPGFFATINPVDLVAYFVGLHRIGRRDELLMAILEPTRFNLAAYEGFSNWRNISHDVDFLNSLEQPIAERFEAARSLFDFATGDPKACVVAHNEPYPDHIFNLDGKVCLIDWENIGLSNRLRDLADIWLRSYADPVWQQRFYQAIDDAGYLNEGGKIVWGIEILMQSVANLGYFDREATREAIHYDAAITSLQSAIMTVLDQPH